MVIVFCDFILNQILCFIEVKKNSSKLKNNYYYNKYSSSQKHQSINKKGATSMGGLGPTEITLIVVSLLVLFGAKKLPEIGKSLGKGLKEFKKATHDLSEPWRQEIDSDTIEPEQSKASAMAQENIKRKNN